MRIVCVSDTHLAHETGSEALPSFIVPPGDMLIHAGDLTWGGRLDEISRAFRWIESLPHPTKIVIAGNHDRSFELRPDAARLLVPKSVVYLEQSAFTAPGNLRVFGSPYTPEFNNWSFNLPRGLRLMDKWASIGEDTDILVTHGPPYSILDEAPALDFSGHTLAIGRRTTEKCGCEELLKRVKVVKPKLHVFGHIHCSRGTFRTEDTLFVNAAIVSDDGSPNADAIVVDISDAPDPSFKRAYPTCTYEWIRDWR